jgi:hypothetical protein
MGTLVQWIWPRASRNYAALVGGVEKDLGSDFIGDLTDFFHRMREEV